MDPYKRNVSEAFDSIASDYDGSFDSSELNAIMRSFSLQTISLLVKPGRRVLDIGCGTGREAIYLAKSGVKVMASDISPKMTELTAAKAKAEGVADMIEVRTIAAGDLGQLSVEGTVFDGAFSSFGALNCEPDLESVAEGIASILHPGSPLVVSMINPFCLTEMVLHGLALRPSKALRRLSTPARMPVAPGVYIEVYLRTLRTTVDAFEPHFEFVKASGLLVLLPPPYMESYWRKLGFLRNPLIRIERILSAAGPLAAFGDHYLLQFRRVA